MKRVIGLLLLVAVFGALGSAPTQAAGPGPSLATWKPLLNVGDVNGDGAVSVGDINRIVVRFGTHAVLDTDGYYVPGENYMLLYDLNGGGAVSVGDINAIVNDFGEPVPLVETQVAKATLATAKYQDWNVAVADGYLQQTQYVANMGIHAQRLSVMGTTFDLEKPVGLIYKNGPGGAPGELIGLWYAVVNPEICEEYTGNPNATLLYGIDPQTCPTVEPEGFDGPEDNTDLSGVQKTWHDHYGICVGNGGTPQAWVAELGPGSNEAQCTGLGGGEYVYHYAWMSHLYNFIPNPNAAPGFNLGRFMMWNNQNLP